MVIVPGKFIYVCTPRTASRSVITALWTVPGVIGSVHRHVDPSEAQDAQEKYQLPILTFTREPCRHLLSHWWRNYQIRPDHRDFTWFIQHGKVGRFRWPFKTGVKENRLNCYHRVANVYFPLELGVEAFFDEWNLQPEKISYIVEDGAHPADRHITDEHHQLVKQHFSEDVALYDYVRKAYDHLS